MLLKFQKGDRSLKKFDKIKDIILSKDIIEPNVDKSLIEKFQNGDVSPEVLDYIKNLKPWKHILISKEEAEIFNKEFSLTLFSGQNVPCIVSKDNSFMIITK